MPGLKKEPPGALAAMTIPSLVARGSPRREHVQATVSPRPG